MQPNTKKSICKYAISFGIIVVLSLILWGLVVLGSFIRISSLKEGIELVFKNSPYAEKYHNLKIKQMKLRVIHSDVKMENVLLEAPNKTKIEVFIVPIMGKYGVFEGVFVYDERNKAEFCGLVVEDFLKNFDYYGVSNTSIEMAKQKLNLLKKHKVDKNEK